MHTLLHLFLFYVVVYTAPVQEEPKNATKIDTSRQNAAVGDPKAGFIDTLNPFNNSPTPDKTKDEQNNSPQSGIPNLFNLTNNPFAQLFSSNSGDGNFLDNVKIFLIGSQGMVLPASSILGGFQSFMQAVGNMGNLIQGAQNLIPAPPGN